MKIFGLSLKKLKRKQKLKTFLYYLLTPLNKAYIKN